MAEIKKYYAKSPRADGSQETVGKHCRKVSELAAAYGSEFGQGDEAALCGLFHDFGKYSKDFQDVLNGTKTGVDHAVCGGTALTLLKKGKVGDTYRAFIEAVNAHHSRLKPYYEIEGYLKDNIKNTEPVICNDGKSSALSGIKEYIEAINAFKADFPQLKLKKFSFILEGNNNTIEYCVKKMMYTRMLFSCLVDADYTVSSEKEPEVLELKPEVI
ncbi:MAG: CRISPR-associated endonuclease Cas3'' [Clostridiales bacterium]|nr:CRISPR-associated endonuclease Cas3'' [Clostridiales bacterium]